MSRWKTEVRKKELRPLRKVAEIHEEEGFDVLVCGHKYFHTSADVSRQQRERRPKSRRCDHCPLALDMEL
jgi:hypothetical protein